MNWIDEFAEASFSLYSGNTLSAFQPLDFFHYYGLWYDLWLRRVAKAMDALDVERKSYQELRHLLPTPSSMRALLQKAIVAYIGKSESPDLYRRYTSFIVRMLREACPSDPFGKTSTPLHSEREVGELVAHTAWEKGTPGAARALGKLLASTGSLVHGLYNDVVTDFGWDAYGPYPTEKDGGPFTLLIRYFPDLQPGLWSETLEAPVRTIEIRQLYMSDVKWSIGCVGCHTLLIEGDPIHGLAHFAAYADGRPISLKKINELTAELAIRGEAIYREIRTKDFEQLKEMVMLQECYQLKKLLDAAGVDWTPTEEMKAAVQGKPLLTGLFPTEQLLTNLDDYKEAFGINRFAREVVGI